MSSATHREGCYGSKEGNVATCSLSQPGTLTLSLQINKMTGKGPSSNTSSAAMAALVGYDL